MLPVKNRLTKKKDFDMVFTGSKSIKNGFLVVKIRENNLKESRIGFMVSKKISNKATVRNTVKRRLRKAFEGVVRGMGMPKDVVVIALPGIQKEEFADIQKCVLKIFNKTQ